MPVYLDIGAQRIQSWIAATPKLDHLRGASRALKDRTAAGKSDPRQPGAKATGITAWLASQPGLIGCEVATEAGEKDGIVVLRCPNMAKADAAAPQLLAHLQQELPRVEWAGWWVEAPTYLDAYLAQERGEPGVRRITGYPALYEVPVLEQCAGCRQEPRRITPEGSSTEGVDCGARTEARESPRDLLYGLPGRWPADFETLALRGGLAARTQDGTAVRPAPRALGRKDSRNHLALIKADGNKVGQLFRALSRHAHALPSLHGSAVADLNAHTQAAVHQAAWAISEADAEVKAALPHYVGGDDVLVSVPAALAWRFATELARAFEELRGTWLRQLDGDLAGDGGPSVRAEVTALIEQVSLGIGMVFARADHPLAATLQVADAALDAAKHLPRGEVSGIAWVDLSAEGIAGARRGRTWTQYIPAAQARRELAELADDPVAEALFAVPPAGRARLAHVIRGAANAAEANTRAALWCQNTGRPDSLLKAVERDAAALLPLLSRARWWPDVATEEDDQ